MKHKNKTKWGNSLMNKSKQMLVEAMKNNLHKLWSILLVVAAIVVCGCEEHGESYDADYGYVGEGKGKVSIYRGKEAVRRSVPQEEAIDALLELIENDQKNK